MSHMLELADVTIIFESDPSEKYVQDVTEVDPLLLTEVIPFIGITKHSHGAIKRGIGVRTCSRVLLFQPTSLGNARQYWHILQLIQRLHSISVGLVTEAIRAGDNYYGNFSLSAEYNDSIVQNFAKARAEAFKVVLDPIHRIKIEEEFLADRALSTPSS